MIRAQNSPRLFAYLVFGITLLVLWLVCLIPTAHFTNTSAQFLTYSGVGLVLVVGATVLIGELAAGETRVLVRGNPLPADADPVRVAVAERLVAWGALGPDPEANRLARTLADQEARKLEVRHPRAWQAFLAAASVGVVVMTARTLVVEGLTPVTAPEVAVHSLIAVFCLWAAWRHPADAAGRRRRAEAVRDAYDHHAAGGR
ncbi:hypothetical protein [Nocardiopsis deserti]|uniref:hypothetical protein n=1 Tax=Nocardiopsis deserti TaxID=2605988 RepID=UPI001CC24645|nr:hypothetical protein [Nocardiopsis deserti]